MSHETRGQIVRIINTQNIFSSKDCKSFFRKAVERNNNKVGMRTKTFLQFCYLMCC